MQALELNFNRLSTNEWEQLAQAAEYPGPCIFLLDDLQKAQPAGSIALILVCRHRRPRYNILALSRSNKEVLKHLIQIGFVDLADRFSVDFDCPNKRLVNQRFGVSENFTQILEIGKPGYEKAQELVQKYLQMRFPKKFSNTWTAFIELLANINDHTGVDKPALHVIQVQGYKDHIELAFGDLGVGYLQSLKRNSDYQSLSSEQEALVKAIQERASGLKQKDTNRGGGLRQALDAVFELGGSFKISSGDGVALRVAQRSQNFEFEVMKSSFPGTLTAIHIPFPLN